MADLDAQVRWDQPCHGAWWHLLSFLFLFVAGADALRVLQGAASPFMSAVIQLRVGWP